MRLWSLHPGLLDQIGLVAAWREGLLAQSVIRKLAVPGASRVGYANHSQLLRFKEQPDPLQAIADWLRPLQQEAALRGYTFREELICRPQGWTRMPLSTGQLKFEMEWLGRKFAARDPACWAEWTLTSPSPHPIFELQEGPVASWERAA